MVGREGGGVVRVGADTVGGGFMETADSIC